MRLFNIPLLTEIHFKVMKYILSIIILLFLFSCKKGKDYQILSIKSGPENSRTIDSIRYRIIVKNDKKIYEYKSLESDNTYFNRIEKNIDNDSILRVYDIECKLIDSHKFKFKNKDVIVYKYNYDIIGQEDEESDYYFTKEYGLIKIESTVWRNVNVIINQEEFKPLQDSILINQKRFKSSFNYYNTKKEEY